jgi:GNAT superfamily N-acetyltransferase
MSTIGARQNPLTSIYVKGFFMKNVTQTQLDEFVFYLKKQKYINKIQNLKLEYCYDNGEPPYIYLALIQIKKSQRNLGYGSAVLSDIINFADDHQIEVRLYATNLYGADIKRLYGYYRKQGFVLIKNNNDGKFIYRPRKKVKAVCNISE